jgi:hypothetical protein
LEWTGKGKAIDQDDGIPKETIAKAIASARDRGTPFATVLMRMTLEDIPLADEGEFRLYLEKGRERQLCAFLRIALQKTDTSETKLDPSEQL